MGSWSTQICQTFYIEFFMINTLAQCTQTHVFRKYLCKNEKFQETIFACSYGPMVKLKVKLFIKQILKISGH